MQRKCHCCNTLFEVHGNSVLCDDCQNPETRKTFEPPKDELTWQQKFDIKWAKYDEEHADDGQKLKAGAKAATHCAVCGVKLPPINERKYGRVCSNACKMKRYEKQN